MAEFPPGDAGWKMYWLVADEVGYVLRSPGYVDFCINVGVSQVNYRRSHQVPAAQVRDFFCGNGISLMLGLSGAATFHASAVAVAAPDASQAQPRAVAIFGGVAAGKSTLAASMVAAGARFVTDDVLRVGHDLDGGPAVVGGCSDLRLRRDVASIQALFPAVISRRTADQRVALPLGEGSLDLTPLGLLLFPRLVATGASVSLSPLSPREVAVRLAGSPRMAGWCLPQVLEAQFGALSEMALRVPAFCVDVPRGAPVAHNGHQLLGQAQHLLWER